MNSETILNYMHYTSRLDKIMGFSNYRHRTLRTVFDCYSSEWDHTSMEKKLMLLEIIIDSNYALEDWIADYKTYYSEELMHMKYVIASLPDALVALYKSASPQLKQKLFSALVKCAEIYNPTQKVSDIEISLEIAREMYG